MLTLIIHAPGGLRPALVKDLLAQVPELTDSMVVVEPGHPSNGQAWSEGFRKAAPSGHVVLLDGRQHPVGWSTSALLKGMESFHLCTFSQATPGPRDLVVNERFGFLEGGLHPGAIVLHREAVRHLAEVNQGNLFNPAFAGVPGHEMDHLGDLAYHLGLSCGTYAGAMTLRTEEPTPHHPRSHEQLALRLRLRSMLRIREDAGTRIWRVADEDEA